MANKSPEQMQQEAARAERLAAALRDNLRRRKGQSRAGDVASSLAGIGDPAETGAPAENGGACEG